MDYEELKVARNKKCWELFGFYPGKLGNYFDVLREAHSALHFYSDKLIHRFDKGMQVEAEKLHFKSDILLFKGQKLMALSTDLTRMAEVNVLTGETPKEFSKGDVEKFKKDIDPFVKEILDLSDEVSVFIKSLLKHIDGMS
ncbi:MAG: hypothetical protein GOV15_00360 [Candidatus Diapherotrites archaeon]|nr:hypothetical protein [Candidatus Diapherotrites archaeon]